MKEKNYFTIVFLSLLCYLLDVRAWSIVLSGQVGVPSLPMCGKSTPVCSPEGGFPGQQDQEGSFQSWLKLIFFLGLDQHMSVRLVWVDRKVKWRRLC
jgi:hypothetical protein